MTPTQSPTLASQATAELSSITDRAPRLHRLKTDPEVYQAVLGGHKTFEIRLNDRDFRIGDELLLMETTFTGEAIRAGAPLQFTGNEMRKRVSHVLSGYGLMPGWVCLSFAGYEAGRASRAQSESETAEHWMHKAHEFQAERDDLRQLLDTRPALNAGLADAYRAWTGKVYAADVYRVAFAAGATPGEKQ